MSLIIFSRRSLSTLMLFICSINCEWYVRLLFRILCSVLPESIHVRLEKPMNFNPHGHFECMYFMVAELEELVNQPGINDIQ